ncbi:PiggyBac transposable element-derived protein [Trichinella pseudospiralis]
MRSRQPVNDETLASSKREDTDISNVALETDDSVVEDSNLDYETYSFSSSARSSDMEEESGSRHSKDELAVIWDTWIKNLPETYNPSENVAVDDRLYPFKGRCQFRQ